MPSVDLRLPIPAGQSVSIRDGDIGFDGCVSTRAFVLEEKIHVACLSTASTARTASILRSPARMAKASIRIDRKYQ